MKKILFALVLALMPFFAVSAAEAQAPAARKESQKENSGKKFAAYAIGFYNLENLFDTIHAKGKNDYDFLPDGPYKWNTVKYTNKLKNMARVLSEMATDKVKAGLAVVGVSEVENRKVLEDLLQEPALKDRGYRILHIESPDRRGVDCALIYNPRFFKLEDSLYVQCIAPDEATGPEPIGFRWKWEGTQKFIEPLPLFGDTTHITRGFLVGIGQLAGERVAFIVNHWPSRGAQSPVRENAGRQVYRLKEALLDMYPGIKIVIEGDLNDDPNNKSVQVELMAKPNVEEAVSERDLFNPWYNMLYKTGQGTLMYRGNWNLFDQIIISGNFCNDPDHRTLSYRSCEVFLRDYMIQQEGRYKGSPLRTTAGGTWLNGYSDHLPTIIYLVKQKQK